MTHTADDYATCFAQERAYTDGWRNYQSGFWQVGSLWDESLTKFYAKGWADHQTRDKCHAMYARKEER